LGIVALPIGAFCFGVCEPVIYFVTHGASFPSDHERFMPLLLGAEYAVLSIISAYAIFVFPLAMLTTFCLRAVILFQRGRQLTAKRH
jgi:hypothetical protein